MSGDLFSGFEPEPAPVERDLPSSTAPLAERLRPSDLLSIVGQEHLTGPTGAVGRMIATGKARSIILWGPPGTGKTTIARLITSSLGLPHVRLSAIGTGVADLKKIFAEAEARLKIGGKPTVVFIDEVHRFNKGQQDNFLPHVEAGTIVLIGATTENPSFELNGALLSRADVLVLKPHTPESLERVLARLEETSGPLPITPDARSALLANAGGDARYMLGQVETILDAGPATPLDTDAMALLLSRRLARHDKAGDGHYDLASAFQKSVRGSDPDAALYYAAKMMDAGEDPAFLFRRLLVMASEEVGMADPTALATVVAARATFDMLGRPEGEYAIAQAIIHVATAPKSNASYAAWGKARELAATTRGVSPPARILNAPTKLMKQMGRKDGYRYDHDFEGAFSGQDFWPDELGFQLLYEPNARGFEEKVMKRLDHWRARREDGRT